MQKNLYQYSYHEPEDLALFDDFLWYIKEFNVRKKNTKKIKNPYLPTHPNLPGSGYAKQTIF